MSLRLLLCAALVCCGATNTFAAETDQPKSAAPFELKDGDRVVFLGNTLIEREQKYGYWELLLTMAWPERNVTFRNLGWSGDTVWGESRAGFGSQRDGFKKLVEEVNAAKPTVIFVGYGNVEAFDGEQGLPKFVDGFGKLLDVLEATKARIVVLGPIHQVVAVSPNPAVKDYDRVVLLYSAELKRLSERRNHRFVELCNPDYDSKDLFTDIERGMTTNGLDVTALGYLLFSNTLHRELGLPKMTLDGSAGHKDAVLRLQAAIQKKNELFFHRWRPQNETYLFGFRKHEQGKNAAEVFQFDPLVEAEEKKIAELREKLAAEMKAIEKNGGAK